NLRDRKAAFIAKIKRIARLVRRNPLEGGNVGVGQVADVDVVTDTGAVWRSIVATEDLDRWSPSHGGKQNERDQMCFGLVQFAQLPVWIGSRRIEITKCDVPDPVSNLRISQHLLHHQLSIAIWIDRLLRISLRQRHTRRNAVGRTRAGKYDVPASESGASLEQFGSATNIRIIVF